jgi:hypothetical protein
MYLLILGVHRPSKLGFSAMPNVSRQPGGPYPNGARRSSGHTLTSESPAPAFSFWRVAHARANSHLCGSSLLIVLRMALYVVAKANTNTHRNPYTPDPVSVVLSWAKLSPFFAHAIHTAKGSVWLLHQQAFTSVCVTQAPRARIQ